MSHAIEFTVDRSNVHQLRSHFEECSSSFVPALGLRVNIGEYAKKLVDNSIRFEAWNGDQLVGCVCAYMNRHVSSVCYISNVSVSETCRRQGVAKRLLLQCMSCAAERGFEKARLEVATQNFAGKSLYQGLGFVGVGAEAEMLILEAPLLNGDQDEYRS